MRLKENILASEAYNPELDPRHLLAASFLVSNRSFPRTGHVKILPWEIPVDLAGGRRPGRMIFFLIISSLFTVCNTRERSSHRTHMSGFCCQHPCPSSMSSGGGAHLSMLPCAMISGTRQRARYHAIFRCVVIVVCDTWQRRCRVLFSLYRVCLAHRKDQLSRSDQA